MLYCRDFFFLFSSSSKLFRFNASWHSHSIVVLVDLIWLKALAAFLHVGTCGLVVFNAYARAGMCRTCAIFGLRGACCCSDGVLDSCKSMHMTIGCVLFIRYAVLWPGAVGQRGVTTTGQTWVYSLAPFHYLQACLTSFPLSAALFQYLSASLFSLSSLPLSPPSVVVVMSRWRGVST